MEQLNTDKFSVQELEKAAGNDSDFFNMMIDNFLNNAKNLLESFNTEIRAENWKEIGEKAHKTIPSFKYFGLKNLTAQLEKIESLALWEHRYIDLPDAVALAASQIEVIINQAVQAKKRK
jgi:HPt (histidine-containing phosphotransfer) domain-containing protein